MHSLPVLLCFGRSGGTLANQLLGTHPDCLVLSEINPAASFKPVVEQAVEWLQLINARDERDFVQLSYVEQLRSLARIAGERGKRLVIRDWTSVNFVTAVSPYAYPSRKLEQLVYLNHAGAAPQPLAFVRRSADVYASWKANFAQFATLEARIFAASYLDYAAAVREYPVVRLEDFRADPKNETARLFNIFGLSTASVDFVLQNFQEFDRCTGNNTLSKMIKWQATQGLSSRQLRSDETMTPADSEVAKQFAMADSWLGYD
jgi:hypothetical protein